MIRFLEIQSPNCRETLRRPLPKATLVCKKKKEEKTRRRRAGGFPSTNRVVFFAEKEVKEVRSSSRVSR